MDCGLYGRLNVVIGFALSVNSIKMSNCQLDCDGLKCTHSTGLVLVLHLLVIVTAWIIVAFFCFSRYLCLLLLCLSKERNGKTDKWKEEGRQERPVGSKMAVRACLFPIGNLKREPNLM